VVVSRLVLAALVFGLPSLWAPGPAENRKGAESQRKGQYEEALKHYGRAMEALPGERIVPYNAGTALLEAKKYDEALKALSAGISDPRREVKAPSLYNTGNALYATEKYPEALTAFKEAVLADPSNMDAKFNYEMAQYRLKKQQEEQEKQDKEQKEQKQDQKENQKSDEQNQDKSEGDQEKNEDGQQQQQPPPEPGEEQEQKPDPGEDPEEAPSEQEPRPQSLLSKEEAERLLDALKANEMEMIKARLKSSRKKNVEKDW
jgi:Ca-activated chloride channel family protein